MSHKKELSATKQEEIMNALWQSGGAGREALREELATIIKTVRFSGNFVNLWGYGGNIYLALQAEGFSDETPILYRMRSSGELESLLTYGEAKSLTGNPNLTEIVATLEAPDGTVFCTTHPEPVHILRKKPDEAWESVYSNAAMRTSYGMATNQHGDIFATLRGPAEIGGPHRAIIRSLDGGDNWSVVWSDNNDWLYSIEAKHTYVVAGGRNIIVRSADRGVSWSTFAATGDVRAVKNIDLERWIAFVSAATGYFYISLNRGASWSRPANPIPIPVVGAPNPVAVRPNGEIFVMDDLGIRFARTRNLSKWSVGGNIYLGAYSRGIYVTESHIYIGSRVLSTSPYYSKPDNGMVLIIPIECLDWTENYPPILLWSNESVTDTVNGEATSPVLTENVDKKTFYLISNQSGTLYIQAYDEVAATYRDIDSVSVSANMLTVYNVLDTQARLMRLRFIPSAAATVSAWVVMK